MKNQNSNIGITVPVEIIDIFYRIEGCLNMPTVVKKPYDNSSFVERNKGVTFYIFK